ncbi:MAG: hypothetical protein WA476_20110, partial [Acidobacteriaceae bacterium]
VQANPRPGLCDHNPRHYRPPTPKQQTARYEQRSPAPANPRSQAAAKHGLNTKRHGPHPSRRAGGGTPPAVRQLVGVPHGGVHNGDSAPVMDSCPQLWQCDLRPVRVAL